MYARSMLVAWRVGGGAESKRSKHEASTQCTAMRDPCNTDASAGERGHRAGNRHHISCSTPWKAAFKLGTPSDREAQ